jgi:hypothetical protein
MAFRVRSNNRILPANSRAVDVATKAVSEIIPVQQERYYNAFAVQGIQCILYHRLSNGRPCTCQSSASNLNAQLDKEGKAPVGAINELLTGNNVFEFDTYGMGLYKAKPELLDFSSPKAPVDPFQGVFDVHTDGSVPFNGSNNVTDQGQSYGDNGPVNTEYDIEDMVGSFDASSMGLWDTKCPICFGTGYVGGYSAFQGNRKVIPANDIHIDGELDVLGKPWTATTRTMHFTTVLPIGALSVDAFRVMNGRNMVGGTLSIDGTTINGIRDLLAKCDGQQHTVAYTFKDTVTFTHVEIQFGVSAKSTFFEFPRLSSSSDTSKLDPTSPFQIVLSPNVPVVNPMDIIAESRDGMVLIVNNVNEWKSRQRNVLGWECEVRVLQPPESQRILPIRGRVMTKDVTTQNVRDNVTGPRRT